MNQTDIKELLEETKLTNRLLVFGLIKGQSQNDSIASLRQIGFTHARIGEVLGITENAVAKSLKRIKTK